MAPEITIVIPSHNCGIYLERCIRSLFNQKFDNFEIILVLDSCTDNSLEIAAKLAEEDKRLTYYSVECRNAGASRNFAFDKIKGNYVIFLDSDDFFEPELLKHSYNRIVRDQSEVCVFNAFRFKENTQKIEKTNYYLRKYMLSKQNLNKDYIPLISRVLFTKPVETIIPDEYNRLFNFTTAAPWNKLFKTSLIMDNNLRFAELPRFNDLQFILTAMAKAKKISILNEKLINYSKNPTSLQATKDKTPLCAYESKILFKQVLIEKSLYEKHHIAFNNYVLNILMLQLGEFKTYEAFSEYVEYLKANLYKDFDILEMPRTKVFENNQAYYNLMKRMFAEDPRKLFDELHKSQPRVLYLIKKGLSYIAGEVRFYLEKLF